MSLDVDRKSNILSLVMEGFITVAMEHADNDIASLDIVVTQEFYDGKVIELITNDDKTNSVFVVQNDAAHTHKNAPFGYVFTKE